MKDNKSRSTCLLGGDPECCEDCIYGADYHYVDGECVERDPDTQVKKLENKSNNFEVKSNMRDRLLALLRAADRKCWNTQCENCIAFGKGEECTNHLIADYLLANGVVVIDTDVISPENRPLITQCFGIPLDEMIEIITKNDRSTTLTTEDRKYKPTCKYGYEDCVWDPAYIKYHHPGWYGRLFGDISPEEASLIPGHSCMLCTDNNFLYDDEDK